MAWVKLDDAMPQHPKSVAAGPQAFALDVAAICYSNRHGTDGHIPAAVLPAVLVGLTSPKRWAARLVEVGRWHTPGHSCPTCPQPADGWQIHDIGHYQFVGEERTELSRKRAEAGRRGGIRSGQTRRSKREASASSNGKQDPSKQTKPDPTRPDPTPKTPDVRKHIPHSGDHNSARARRRKPVAARPSHLDTPEAYFARAVELGMDRKAAADHTAQRFPDWPATA